MTAETVVNQIITNAQTTANTARDKAISYADDAESAASGRHFPGTVLDPTRPNVTIPDFGLTIPVDLSSDFLTGYDNAINALDTHFEPGLIGAMNTFMTKYFPNYTQCLQTALDGWICNTITVGGTGIPADVENAIWNRGREREVIDARRVVEEAVSGFAARGWSLPSGVLVDTVYRAQQAASDKASTISRDVMIKQAEVEIDNIKFAIEQGIKLRLGIQNALIAFIKAWMDIREHALEKAKAIVEAKSQLYQTAAEYYRAIVAAAGLYLEYDKIRIEKALTIEKIHADSFFGSIDNQTKALISAAEAMGEMAAAALGSQNTLAEVAHNTQVSSES